jgi:hypothetical protein
LLKRALTRRVPRPALPRGALGHVVCAARNQSRRLQCRPAITGVVMKSWFYSWARASDRKPAVGVSDEPSDKVFHRVGHHTIPQSSQAPAPPQARAEAWHGASQQPSHPGSRSSRSSPAGNRRTQQGSGFSAHPRRGCSSAKRGSLPHRSLVACADCQRTAA